MGVRVALWVFWLVCGCGQGGESGVTGCCRVRGRDLSLAGESSGRETLRFVDRLPLGIAGGLVVRQ